MARIVFLIVIASGVRVVNEEDNALRGLAIRLRDCSRNAQRLARLFWRGDDCLPGEIRGGDTRAAGRASAESGWITRLGIWRCGVRCFGAAARTECRQRESRKRRGNRKACNKAHVAMIPKRFGIAKTSAWSPRAERLYSVRSAAIGLMRVARRAGSQVATRAAAASRAGATVKATGSSAPIS